MIIVRFADDAIIGFQSKVDADQFRAELEERMSKFNLALHPEKTRLMEFGPFAIDNRKRRGEGRPETFNFLGFTHICIKKRSNGMFTVLRQTIRKRMQAKLNAVKAALQRRMHEPIPEQGKWLQAVVRGHIRYYGVPMNQPALSVFRFRVAWLWHRVLSRRSQNGRAFGIACGAWSTAGCLCLPSVIPILSAAWASLPKARAGCGKPACPDPWRVS
jgi:hypothetical protein